jgi:hypothetical protein
LPNNSYPENNTGIILLSNEFDPHAEFALVTIALQPVKGMEQQTNAARQTP